MIIQRKSKIVSFVDIFRECRCKIAALPVIFTLQLEAELVDQEEHLYHTGVFHHFLSFWGEFGKALWAHFEARKLDFIHAELTEDGVTVLVVAEHGRSGQVVAVEAAKLGQKLLINFHFPPLVTARRWHNLVQSYQVVFLLLMHLAEPYLLLRITQVPCRIPLNTHLFTAQNFIHVDIPHQAKYEGFW